MNTPTLDLEFDLLRRGALHVAGIDEVGRGALAGPVTVGIVVIDHQVPAVPHGLADSKLISARRRTALIPALREWVLASAVGHATPAEIDEVGIVSALRLAALRALRQLPMTPSIAILDGSHDWLTAKGDLFDEIDIVTPPVQMRVKADRDCASVAAASVLAKVERDAIMVQLDTEYPGYGLASNKGYGSAAHMESIAVRGTAEVHRRSWNL